MNEYKFEYWFRYGEFEKDFEYVILYEDTLELAKQKVYEIRRWIFKVVLLENNNL